MTYLIDSSAQRPNEISNSNLCNNPSPLLLYGMDVRAAPGSDVNANLFQTH